MDPPAGNGASPAPIDRPILEYLRTRLQGTRQVHHATVSDAGGHLELRVRFEAAHYPPHVTSPELRLRWYTNDDFAIHYREQHPDRVWTCRWDRHPNPHNARDHFHPPPDARAPGEDADWPADHRDVLRLVLDEIEERITQLWDA